MFSLKSKLLFLSIAPAILVAILSSIILIDEYEHKENLELTKKHIEEAESISKVIHFLQIERGLSVGLVTNNNSKTRDNLNKIRKLSDRAICDSKSTYIKESHDYHILETLDDIDINRNKIDLLDASDSDIKIYYTRKIGSFLEVVKKIPTTMEDREDRNLIQAYSYLASTKESFGTIRAILYKVFIDKSFDDDSYFQLTTSFEAYSTNSLNFITIAPKVLLNFYESTFNSEETTETFKMINTALRENDTGNFNVEPSEWFKKSTNSINLLHDIELKLFKITNDSVDQKIQIASEKIKFLIIFLVLIALVFGAIILYIVRVIFVSTSLLKQDYSNSISLLEQYKATVDRSFIVSKTNAKGIITYVNDEFCKISGYSQSELLGVPHNILRHPETAEKTFRDLWHTIKDMKQPWFGEIKNRKKDGSDYWIKSIINPIFDEYGNLIEYIGIKVDITQQKQIEQYFKERLQVTEKNFECSVHLSKEYEKAIDLSVILSRTDKDGKITYANDKFLNITGYTLKEIIGENHNIFKSDETDSETYNQLWETIASGNIWQGILKNKTKSGKHYWADITIVPIRDINENIIEYLAIYFDVTKIIEQKKEFELIAKIDSLTGLGNRFKLNSDIEESRNVSIVVFNLDDFRQINDFYGHRFGDLIIRKVAKRINQTIAKNKNLKLYRLQGDEFAILARDYNKEEFIEKCYHILHKIKEDFYIQNEQVNVSCRCGVSFEEKDLLLTTANMMLEIAKKNNTNLLVYSSDKSLSQKYENNMSWARKLKIAIENDKVIVYYQPIVNNSNLNYEKHECLVRIIDENGEIISPFFFLEIAKKTKQYFQITKTVITKSFEMFKDKDLEFSINLSIKDILEPEIIEHIIHMLEKYNIGKKVVFEIVESESIDNFEEVMKFIGKIKKYGCKIAIDDFGTGYSNFEYLIKLKADYLKIDGSLIKNIDKDEVALLVVSAIVDFSKKLKMEVIAEFVENETIFNIVKGLGIKYSQGYYFSQAKEEPIVQIK